MAPIAKSRRLTCLLGLIDPYGLFQIETTVTCVTLEAKNVLRNPLQTWGFLGQKGPPPATVLDPLRTWHDPYHQKLDV